ncbi:BrnA antitoxin family protein [Aquabacter spiritensis]|uniref:BrnA antitoxin of type II toxin-antitoxin system n=1 Tax=Aquabacter spiritensis TaxID=933073 RepID=A0A4R3LSE4_9HYPH|nr:BrnA antitoxin family protein [Aquabacter spiritensis]TCT03291.1 BrnA antitoxin of type II toxin-antitoxin system [Aquabacter spiritensis]
MSQPPIRRSGGSARDTAEAAFRSATTKPVPEAPKAPRAAAIPNAKETVSIRIDRDVLEHFQEAGPGWQERINQVLRKAMADTP